MVPKTKIKDLSEIDSLPGLGLIVGKEGVKKLKKAKKVALSPPPIPESTEKALPPEIMRELEESFLSSTLGVVTPIVKKETPSILEPTLVREDPSDEASGVLDERIEGPVKTATGFLPWDSQRPRCIKCGLKTNGGALCKSHLMQLSFFLLGRRKVL